MTAIPKSRQPLRPIKPPTTPSRSAVAIRGRSTLEAYKQPFEAAWIELRMAV